jgi:hypothetical protein
LFCLGAIPNANRSRLLLELLYMQVLKQKERESKPSRPCILVMGSEKTRIKQHPP